MLEAPMDQSVAYTALLDLGCLAGLTVEEGAEVRERMLAAWYAQDEVANMYTFARQWKKDQEAAARWQAAIEAVTEFLPRNGPRVLDTDWTAAGEEHGLPVIAAAGETLVAVQVRIADSKGGWPGGDLAHMPRAEAEETHRLLGIWAEAKYMGGLPGYIDVIGLTPWGSGFMIEHVKRVA